MGDENFFESVQDIGAGGQSRAWNQAGSEADENKYDFNRTSEASRCP